MGLPTRAIAVTTLVISSGCGASPPPQAAPPLEVPAVVTPAAEPARDTLRLPSAPAGMSGALRVRDVTAVAREIFSMMGVPPGIDPATMLKTFIDDGVIAAIDLGAPMDALNINVPERRTAAAFTLRAEGEGILREHFDLRADGALVHLVKRERDNTSHSMSSCALHAGRVVCAYDEKTLAESAPYLVTTIGLEPLDHSIRLIVPGTTIRERDRDKNVSEEDRLATELLRGLKEEIDRVDVDIDLGPTFSATLTLRLLSREAPLTRALVPSGRVGPPPPAFARLPSDALLSVWSNGAAADDLTPLKKAVLDDLQTTLESDGYSKEAAQASLDELGGLFLTGGPFALATGKTKSTWFLAAVDEPAQRWTNGLRALVKKSDEAERTRKKPAGSARRHPDGDDIAARVVAVTPAAKLPADSLHLEVKLTPKQTGAGKPRIAHLWVVPDGDRTWIAYGDDDAAVRERVRAARDKNAVAASPAPPAPSALAGGHATTNGLVALFAPEKSVAAGRGDDRISISAVTDPKALVVRVSGSREAAIDFGKTFL